VDNKNTERGAGLKQLWKGATPTLPRAFRLDKGRPHLIRRILQERGLAGVTPGGMY
jgi:hypothetical protein